MKILLISFCFSIFFAQKSVRVYVNSVETKFTEFEKKVITGVIDSHNRISNEALSLEFVKYKIFSSIFDSLKSKSKEDYVIGINTVSITEERKKIFSFSSPYLISKAVILSKKHKTLEINKNTRISYTTNTIQDKMILNLAKKYKFKAIPYGSLSKRYQALEDKIDDYGLGDYLNYWVYGFNLVSEIEDYGSDQLGVIFVKDSEIYKKLLAALNYYFSSPKYFNLIKSDLGVEYLSFVQRQNAILRNTRTK